MIRKQFDIKMKELREDGGRILITTGAVDRMRDRVIPSGARIENYMKNPVVQWGHNYSDPWATIGKTNSLTLGDSGIEADFTLRPAANEHDPQHIIRLLWTGGWINAASIGFDPSVKAWEENDAGGRDFTQWDLLEWSLVPIPANQEALRLAVKALTTEDVAPAVDGTAHDEPEPISEQTANVEPTEPDSEPEAEELDAPPEDELSDEVIDALADVLSDLTNELIGA